MTYFHQPVLVDEVLALLNLKPNQNVIDGTVGGGGHAQAILKKTSPNGKLLGLDRDPKAISAAKENLKKFGNRAILICESYKNTNKIIYEQRPLVRYHHFFLDLGLSSAQVAPEDERGFSFHSSQKLDMRFGPDTDLTAAELINRRREEDLVKIFKEYGEERFAKPIAQAIVSFRKTKLIETAAELSAIVEDVYPKRFRHQHLHPATRIFQALRIAVNNELENLKEVLPEVSKTLPKKGRIAVISYHSLEDRIVKNYFRQETRECLCPKEVMICQCGHQASLKLITKKPLTPTEGEIQRNPRSRSAKLRVAEKIIKLK
jgi:16S rRNA (cytosine1402-N4)-methyltransferase